MEFGGLESREKDKCSVCFFANATPDLCVCSAPIFRAQDRNFICRENTKIQNSIKSK